MSSFNKNTYRKSYLNDFTISFIICYIRERDHLHFLAEIFFIKLLVSGKDF